MTKRSIEILLERVASWPDEAQDEFGDEERAKLLAELRGAEAEVASGQFIEYDSEAFKQRLTDIYRGKRPTIYRD